MGALSGKVAVVTGSSRGMGRGIALALAEQGATVYVTARTVKPGVHPLPGTVGEVVAEVDRRGGKGIGVQVDFGDDQQIATLFARIKSEQGRLDILVNNAIWLPEDMTEPGGFWEKPISDWHLIDIGLRSYYVAAWHAAHIMGPQSSGLIVDISGYVGVTDTCRNGMRNSPRSMGLPTWMGGPRRHFVHSAAPPFGRPFRGPRPAYRNFRAYCSRTEVLMNALSPRPSVAKRRIWATTSAPALASVYSYFQPS